MAGMEKSIRFLEEYRAHPEKYLPLVSHAWQQVDKVDYGKEWYDDPITNVGWNAGVAWDNRPWFLMCWAMCGVTTLTYFVSTEGIADRGQKELLAMLEEAKLVRVLNPEKPRTGIMTFTDDNGNEFFSINIVCGDWEGTYTSGGKIFPFSALNEYNLERERQEAKKG